MKLREGFAMFILIVIALIWLTGCASESAYRDYTIAYTGYMNSQKAKQAEAPKLVEIVAKDGETITMQGVKSFTVYAPAGHDKTIVEPQQIKNSEWVGTVNNIVSGAVSFGSTAVLGSVMKSVVNSVGENAGHNTSITNTDSGNTTTTMTNTNSGNTLTDSGNTITATITDSHNTDNHSIVDNSVAK